MSAKGIKNIYLVFVGVFFIVLDQLSKLIIKANHSSLIVENNGVVWGYITNPMAKVIITLAGLIILAIIFSQAKLSSIWQTVAIVLVASGVLSNIVDRILYSSVIDFIHLPNFLSWWPTFNIADIYIFVGIVIYGQQVISHKS